MSVTCKHGFILSSERSVQDAVCGLCEAEGYAAPVRYVVEKCDNQASPDIKRFTWAVIRVEGETRTCVGDYDTRIQARFEARALRTEGSK